jgi:hypothetical protein
MRKGLIILGWLLLPSALWAQGALRVSSVVGQVEWRAASSRNFVPLIANGQVVQAGDELRTASGASVILTVPDGSYMVVSENAKLIVDDFWSGNLKSVVNLMLGQIRFYIQRFGGRPNPYSVRTPTALIAVRGTVFDVIVDDAQQAEVRCLDGRVTVENLGAPDREVILEAGFKTLVRPGEVPTPPLRNEAELLKNRVIRVQKKAVPSDAPSTLSPAVDALARDNDRRNRPGPSSGGSNSSINSNSERAKPTLSFPQ